MVGCYLLKSLAEEAEAEEETDLALDLNNNAKYVFSYEILLLHIIPTYHRFSELDDK